MGLCQHHRYKPRQCVIWAVVVVYIIASPYLPCVAQEDPHANLSSPIDTHTCLGCHDGSIAEDETNHPIGTDYATSFLYKRGTLKPITVLSPSIRLEDGRVGCTSCHDITSPLPGKLTLAITGSGLCFACHDL